MGSELRGPTPYYASPFANDPTKSPYGGRPYHRYDLLAGRIGDGAEAFDDGRVDREIGQPLKPNHGQRLRIAATSKEAQQCSIKESSVLIVRCGCLEQRKTRAQLGIIRKPKNL